VLPGVPGRRDGRAAADCGGGGRGWALCGRGDSGRGVAGDEGEAGEVGRGAFPINRITPYDPIMAAGKWVPVSEEVWADLSVLKGAGQTYDDLIASMIEQEKKRRFIEEMDRIEEEGDFVEVDVDVPGAD